jgi:pyrophosphate--fructose-6-phosphate 1-phosphotransferase
LPNISDLLSHAQVARLTSKENDHVRQRRSYAPPICSAFKQPYTMLEEDQSYAFNLDREARRQLTHIIENKVQRIVATDELDAEAEAAFHRARNIGVVFSGGPAPGGHNVIAGIFDAARRANPKSKLYGFLLGPDGVIENEVVKITRAMVDDYRNTGGFGMIKTGRTKIDTPEKMALSRQTCQLLKLDALVVVGGDDSNTNAAFLAQELFEDGVQVIGVPKTIDGDIQVRDEDGRVLCAMSFGFHSAARAFANEISGLCTDCSSDVKYWHICKVMGRVASHLALEVALQTHANMTLIGEDLAAYVDRQRLQNAQASGQIDYQAYGITLRHLSRVISEGIVRRAAAGKNYGVIIIPEGVLEFVNEIQVFIIKLNAIIAEYNQTHDTNFHIEFKTLQSKLEYLHRLARDLPSAGAITTWNERDDDLFNDIPSFFQEGLLSERDSHGNFQFSLVETDKVLMGLVKDYLEILREKGIYKIGIARPYFRKTMREAGLNPDQFGPVLFNNYEQEEKHLLFRDEIISYKMLKQALVKEALLSGDEEVPPPVRKVYQKSVPQFKTQTHFYGYDGRGGEPTRFDCNYTYNLGLTVFSLIANGATGQMAVIRNLEKSFEDWEPLGVPIAPLMHLEERKGRLALVLERSVVDTHSVAFRVVEALRETWLAAHPGEDHYRRPAANSLFNELEEHKPITLALNALDMR